MPLTMAYHNIPPRNNQDTAIKPIYQTESSGSTLHGMNQSVPKSSACVEVHDLILFLLVC